METTQLLASPLDIALGPDPGPRICRADRHYHGVTTARGLAAAEKRHIDDLRARFQLSEDWHADDFSVKDLELCWTDRQLIVVLLVEMVALLAVIVALVFDSVPVMVVAGLGSVVLVPYLGRDAWRRGQLWMLEERK